MITIPPARENMTKAELRKLVVEMADWINDVSDQLIVPRYPEVHPLDTHVQDRMEDSLAKVQETRSESPKWGPGQISGHLTNRQGIQQNVNKLTDEERKEIEVDNPSLLSEQP